MSETPSDFERYLASRRRRTEEALERYLPAELETEPARTVIAAMRYATLGPGKRLRAVLTHATYEACGGAGDAVNVPAAAMELIHAYSLVHDDLPAMDDDDLRRGRPTVHRVYGEAAAILAGDALQTLAFELLATLPAGDEFAVRRLESVGVAAGRSGFRGLIGGQIADLEADRLRTDASALDWIHRRKTGALFSACAEIGAVFAGASPERREAVARFGEGLGLAFQIIDDLLDRTGSAESLGKTPGKDDRGGKASYPALHGIRGSRQRAERLLEELTESLGARDVLSETLAALCAHVVSRRS